MIQYRIKEENGYFYPQYKHSLETFWCWNPILRPAMDQYTYGNREGYVESFFHTLDEARQFVEKERKRREVKYHNFKKITDE